MNKTEKIKVDAVDCGDNLLIKPRNYYQLRSLLCNGKEANKWSNEWYIVPKESKLTVISEPKRVSMGFYIKDKELISAKMPEHIDKSYKEIDHEGECFVFKEPYSGMYDLYEETWEDVLPEELEVDLGINIVAELSSVPIRMERGVLKRTPLREALPEPVSAMIPCEISSDKLYEIVREHIKSNIDPKWAVITSDYDFCFTVKKRIMLNKPCNKDFYKGLFTGRKVKKVTRYVDAKEVEIFEMTPSSRKYSGYTVIDGMKAESEADMVEKLIKYLDDLMEKINKPLVECPHCNGLGVTGVYKIATNGISDK